MGVRYNPNDLFDEHGNLRNELERDPFHIPPFNPENFRLYREKIPEDVGSDKRIHQHAIWTHFDYSVGIEGYDFRSRRDSLIRIFQSYLVPTTEAHVNYLTNFGPPASSIRSGKIFRYLKAQISDKSSNPRMKQAVTDWRRDEKWFKKYLSMIADIEAFNFVDSLDDASLEFNNDKSFIDLMDEFTTFL